MKTAAGVWSLIIALFSFIGGALLIFLAINYDIATDNYSSEPIVNLSRMQSQTITFIAGCSLLIVGFISSGLCVVAERLEAIRVMVERLGHTAPNAPAAPGPSET